MTTVLLSSLVLAENEEKPETAALKSGRQFLPSYQNNLLSLKESRGTAVHIRSPPFHFSN